MTVENTKVIAHLYEPYIYNHIAGVEINHEYSGTLYSKDYYDKDKYKVVLSVDAMNRRVPKWISISSKDAGYNGVLFPRPIFSAMDNLDIIDSELLIWMRFGLYLANIKHEFLNDMNYEEFTFYQEMLHTIKPMLRLRNSDFGQHYDLLW